MTREIRLPSPAPWLADVQRVNEPGSETNGYVCLDRNERIGTLPDSFIETIRQSLNSTLLTQYPTQDELRRQLSNSLSLPSEQLLLTAGSDSAVKAMYQAYIQPGDGVVMLDPSYAMYGVYARIFAAKPVVIGYDVSLRLDTEHLLRSMVPGTRLVLIANPNQPTATLLNEDVLTDLLDRAAEIGALVAIDEAYYPFSHVTALSRLEGHPNMLVLRTFSKAAGLAGLRIGFVAGHADVIANLYKVRSVYDVNSFAILCASEVLRHPEVANDYVTQVEAGGRLLAERAIDKVLADEGVDPLEQVRKLAEKRAIQLRHLAPGAKKRRILGYLERRGFVGWEVRGVVEEILAAESE